MANQCSNCRLQGRQQQRQRMRTTCPATMAIRKAALRVEVVCSPAPCMGWPTCSIDSPAPKAEESPTAASKAIGSSKAAGSSKASTWKAKAESFAVQNSMDNSVDGRLAVSQSAQVVRAVPPSVMQVGAALPAPPMSMTALPLAYMPAAPSSPQPQTRVAQVMAKSPSFTAQTMAAPRIAATSASPARYSAGKATSPVVIGVPHRSSPVVAFQPGVAQSAGVSRAQVLGVSSPLGQLQ